MSSDQTQMLARIRRVTRRREDAEQAFVSAIREAAGTVSIRQIAEATGYSSTRVHQLVHGTNR